MMMTHPAYLSHLDILIRKSIRNSKILRTHPKFLSGEILGNFKLRSGQNYIKKLCQEIPINDLESPTVDPERDFIDLEKKSE